MLAVPLSGCASATNYLDPAGPMFMGHAAGAAPATVELRVVTLNLKFGTHVERAERLFAATPQLAGADLIVLQEMDEPGTARFGSGLGMNYLYVPSAIHSTTRRDFGVAILSRWTIDDAKKIPLPHRHRFRKLQRAAAAATVRTALGDVRVYAVHLETRLGASDRDRRDQVDEVLRDVDGWSGIVVIAGDFNDRDAAAHAARAGFAWPTSHVHDDAAVMDVDHILVRGLCAAGAASAGKARDDFGASDHRAVWVVVRRCDAASPPGRRRFAVFRAKAMRVDPGEFGAKEKDLGGVVDPDHQHRDRAGRSET